MICQSVAWNFFFNLKSLGPLNLKKVYQRLNKLLRWACLVNVAAAANCVVAVLYIRYTCDHGMWPYGITVTADVALCCKLIIACGVRINPAQGFNWICRRPVPHSVITGIAESYKVEHNLQRSATFLDHCFGGCWVVDFWMWHPQSLLCNSRKEIDFRLWRCLIIKFKADATFTKHGPQKNY
jgi:hypothetical protein